jgi:hypothetical protein
MNRTVSQAGRILGVAVLQVKKWAWLFREHLDDNADPAKGQPRTFADADVLVLIYVAIRSTNSLTYTACRGICSRTAPTGFFRRFARSEELSREFRELLAQAGQISQQLLRT